MRTSRILICVLIAVLSIGVVTAVAQSDSPPKKYTETVTANNGDKVTFDMVLVPGGRFKMGSPADEPGRQEHEGPQFEAKIEPFYLCTTEATLDLFLIYYREAGTGKKEFFEGQETEKKKDVDAITGPTVVFGDLTMGYDESHPAIGMTWLNAVTFAKWVSYKTGKEYRLPTEAEWEYAARLGRKGLEEKMEDYAWCEANSMGETHPVGEKKPNALGIYDMFGNVREWVWDYYSPTAYKDASGANPVIDYKGPAEGKVHVARGGDYNSPANQLRCADRSFEETWWRSGDPQIPKSRWWLPQMDFIGLRLARSAEPSEKR